MLSAFTARPIVELKQRDRSKIESILAYGDRLLVGLNTGSLRIYRVNELPPDEQPKQNGNATADETPSSRPGSSSKPKPVDLLRELEKFSSRSIEQLAIIKEANILISLSNSYVSIHDLQSYTLQEQLARTKNATTFAVTSNIVNDPATGIPEIISRLAVAVKRRLLLWSWHESELSPEVTEITLASSILKITWASATKMICGLNSSFVIVDVVTQEVHDIVGPGAIGGAAGTEGSRFGGVGSAGMGYIGLGGYAPKPLVTRLGDGDGEGELLLAKDINSLFINAEGKPLEKKQVPWQQAPESIGYSYPYMLSLQSAAKGALEVRNPKTLNLLQTVSLPNASQLHFPPPTVSLAHAGKGFHVASDRCVWKMEATNYDRQIDQLVEGGHHDEAISILDMLEDALLRDKEGRKKEIKLLKAQHLFEQRKYQDALDLFTEVMAPPERVIRLYPSIIAGDLSSVDGKSDHEATANITSPNGSDHKENGTDAGASTPPQHDAPALDAIIGSPKPAAPALNKILMRGHRKAHSDTSSIRSFMRVDTLLGTGTAASADDAASIRPGTAADEILEGKDLENAVNALNGFLSDTRARRLNPYLDPVTGTLRTGLLPAREKARREALVSLLHVSPPTPESPAKQNNQLPSSSSSAVEDFDSILTSLDVTIEQLRDVARLVDTTLFRGYMLVRPSLAGSLFRLPNFCDPAVVNEKLLESGRYSDLVDFFYGKGLHGEALGLLRRFGCDDDHAETGERDKEDGKDDQHEDEDGQRKPSTTSIPPPDSLRGPTATIAYLQKLGPQYIDHILEHAAWVLRSAPEEGMQIFLADSENAETLPRGRVVEFLHEQDKLLQSKQGGERSGPSLAVQYLEHLIYELNDTTPAFHNLLVRTYVEEVKARLSPDSEGRDGEGWKEQMVRLVRFLRESTSYSLSKAFGLIPRDDPPFYEAQAVILSNMGQHKQALEIYVFKIGDFDKAEEYCNRVHLAESTSAAITAPSPKASPEETSTSIYHTLLSLYLSPPPPHSPANFLAPALSLLSHHPSRLPPSATLSLLPTSLPISALQNYFTGRIRASNSILNMSKIEAGLRAAEVVRAQGELLLGGGAREGVKGRGRGGRSRKVLVEEDRVCGVCHKRLGGSVIALLPEGDKVVHYGCLNRKLSFGSGG